MHRGELPPGDQATLTPVQFIARVEAAYGVHFVRIAPIGSRFQTNVRPRPAVGELITIAFEGLGAVNAESLELWRARHARADELDRRFYRPTTLADLMTAVNAELWIGIAREANADDLAAFALDRGGTLLSTIRAELAGEVSPVVVTQQARRFSQVLNVPYAEETLGELAALHAVEQLMGLEHAVVSWMRAEPRDELVALASELPDDGISAGVSAVWQHWWWRLARACTRADLRAIVAAAIALAQRECRYNTRAEIAGEACDEAMRMAECARVASRAEMWADVPQPMLLSEILRDENDAHYASYMALTHCAHAIAAALRADMDTGDANRHAMQLVANCALELLR